MLTIVIVVWLVLGVGAAIFMVAISDQEDKVPWWLCAAAVVMGLIAWFFIGFALFVSRKGISVSFTPPAQR